MSISKICKNKVVTANKSMSIVEAAKLMKENNIGDIVIVASETNEKPIGILTDRDIAIKIIANNLAVEKVSAGDVMSDDLLILKKHQSINEALEMMSAKGVRRAPVIDENTNAVCGVISIDDLLVLIAEELSSLARLVRKQIAD